MRGQAGVREMNIVPGMLFGGCLLVGTLAVLMQASFVSMSMSNWSNFWVGLGFMIVAVLLFFGLCAVWDWMLK